jgi:glycosyltransferase involved in cell wall biosynthesis
VTSSRELRVAIDVSAIPERPAGAGRYVIELVSALGDRDDVALTLVTRSDDADRWRHDQDTVMLSVAPRSLPLRLAFGEFLLGRTVQRHGGADVLHGPHYTLPLGASAPAVVTVHDLTLLEHPEWHESAKVVFFRRALRLAVRRAKVIVVPSEFVAIAYQRHFGARLPVRVIPHGVDHQRFSAVASDPTEDGRVLARLGINWPYVVNVATLEPRKNQPLLVAAFSRVAKSDPELRLVLAGGSGWKSDELDRAIAISGVSDRVVRLGYVTDLDVPALLRSAAAVAYPSIEEGFGLPALEALACGAPLVTTAGSAMAEVSGDAALLVDAHDVVGLAEALEELIAGGSAVSARRALGVARAGTYTWAASAFAHMEAYELARSS